VPKSYGTFLSEPVYAPSKHALAQEFALERGPKI